MEQAFKKLTELVLTAHIKKTKEDGARTAARLRCADGFTVSVQAGQFHYCTPRTDEGPWYEFECGFPSKPVPEWLQWRDGDYEDTETVIGCVPADVIWNVLEAHGGVINLCEKDGDP